MNRVINADVNAEPAAFALHVVYHNFPVNQYQGWAAKIFYAMIALPAGLGQIILGNLTMEVVKTGDGITVITMVGGARVAVQSVERATSLVSIGISLE